MASRTKSSINSKKATYRRNGTQAKKKNTENTTTKKIIEKEKNEEVLEVKELALEEKQIEEEREQMQEIVDKNGFSMAGIICSFCGLITCGITSLAGIVLSVLGLKKSKELNGVGKTMAITGIISGVVITVFMALAFLSIIVLSNNTYGEAIRKAKNKKI